jgi:hypothetical protein
MSLDAVKQTKSYNENMIAGGAVFEKWQDFPVSKISHHGTLCCEMAREWLFAMDFSNLNGASRLTGPRWIRQKYNWGPTTWQIYWCEAVRQKSLDCGAQAALAQEVYSVRGVKSYQAQMVQQFSTEATNQWANRWNCEETSVHWINNDLIYHEGCAVLVRKNEIKLWDASAGWWINPNQFEGYGSRLAVRFFAPPDDLQIFNWGEHRLTANKWQKILKL